MEQNPYSSPKLPDVPSRGGQSLRTRHSRFFSTILGCGIGLAVGVFWTIIIGPITDGPPPIMLSLLIYSTSFALTGLTVGFIRVLPPVIGAFVGLLTASTWAIVAGPKDGWIIVWLIVFGGSGLFGGGLIGVLFWLIPKKSTRLDHNPAN